jgi:hypothetical protein
VLRQAILLGVGLAAAVAPAAASAATHADTSRVDVAWMATVTGKQEFTWTASAVSPPPAGCGTDRPGGRTRAVRGSGSFALTFATPRAYRMETVQIFRRAGSRHALRSLSYRPRGAPKLENDVRFPVQVAIAGSFVDDVQACDDFDASHEVAPTTGCASRKATLDLRLTFGVIGAHVRNDADLAGTLVRPWYLDADDEDERTCPTYESAATEYFNVGRGTAACPDIGALDSGDGPPEAGLAKAFHKGRFLPRLVRARPKAFTLRTDRRMDCTLTPAESWLPPLAADGKLHITGSLRYVWKLTPRKVRGSAARPKPV